jgi:hypothetical protein
VCTDRNPLSGAIWQDPNEGTTSFDNYGWSVVTLFQVCTRTVICLRIGRLGLCTGRQTTSQRHNAHTFAAHV